MGAQQELLSCKEALFFCDEFREARAVALKDAEGYQQILFVLERLGAHLCKKIGTLSTYERRIKALVNAHHPLEKEWKEWPSYRACHTAFGNLYEMVKLGRNDALHQGAVARNLTSHSIRLSLVLEDALMSASKSKKIGDYMVQNPVCVYPWQPVSFVRQMMLENSFSYIPVYMEKKDTEEKAWHVIADYHIVEYLQSTDSRKKLLAKSLKEASKDMPIELAYTVCRNKTVREVLKCAEYAEGKPILVVAKRDNREELLGIATAHDLM